MEDKGHGRIEQRRLSLHREVEWPDGDAASLGAAPAGRDSSAGDAAGDHCCEGAADTGCPWDLHEPDRPGSLRRPAGLRSSPVCVRAVPRLLRVLPCRWRAKLLWVRHAHRRWRHFLDQLEGYADPNLALTRQRGTTPAATAALASLISDQTLTCRQRDIDRFGRIVGQCFLPDGRDITAAMIASGTATEFCRFSRNYYRMETAVQKSATVAA